MSILVEISIHFVQQLLIRYLGFQWTLFFSTEIKEKC